MEFKEFIEKSRINNMKLHNVILEYEYINTGVPVDRIRKEISELMKTLLEEADKNYGEKKETLTGMTGDVAYKLKTSPSRLVSNFNRIAMISAVSFAESNAAMDRILACPTAGSCGIVPGISYALWKEYGDFENLVNSFIVAGAVGEIVSLNATIAGAEGGCQAEIGTGTAMASALIVYYFTENGEMCAHAAALSLKSLMGLVCDPIGGFVEVPCVKRNGIAVNVAIACAEMAMAGVESVIPFDEVVEAMARVGRALPESLRETGKGGIATTPTAKRILHNVKKRLKQ